ncbi:MAG: ATP-binding cassette domain-containing protein [Candidatus Omnitrophota bacterium]|nr:ATP-binding cassette domain-containing protein [Candidatus Omnitrophota bacterium]
MRPILEVKDLTVTIGAKLVIDKISFDLYRERVTALVGESGSGKTLAALSLLDLLPAVAVRKKGEVIFRGKNIFDLKYEEIRKIRGKSIAMVFQEPFTALNPVMRAGDQISEVIVAHGDITGTLAREKVLRLLDTVSLPRGTALSYPHELSGGMRQRIVLAMALACDPEVLLLDEPTTALDVSIQKEILDLIKDIQKEKRFAVLFITHDFSVVNMVADEVCVLKEGVMVEKAAKEDVLRRPASGYTRKLIECIPRLGDKRSRLPA